MNLATLSNKSGTTPLQLPYGDIIIFEGINFGRIYDLYQQTLKKNFFRKMYQKSPRIYLWK